MDFWGRRKITPNEKLCINYLRAIRGLGGKLQIRACWLYRKAVVETNCRFSQRRDSIQPPTKNTSLNI